ncbi:MAG: DNA polymerase I [Planctomycetota bacterium]
MSERQPTCFLIDGHYRLYKAFFAVRGLSTPEGQPIGAVYGFTSSLLKLAREIKPDYWGVCFDRPGKTFRHEMYPAYKGTRKPSPDDFQVQVPLMEQTLEAMGIPVLAVPGYEADDLMGTLSRRWAEAGVQVFLVTNDKDAKQLLGPTVSMYDLDLLQPWTADDLRQETGLAPPQMIDLLALTGDTSDNVPGVPKVGEKTALPLILEYGDLDGVIAHVDEIEGNARLDLRGKAAVAERIKEFADQARLSRRLVTIDCDAPVEVELDDLRRQEFSASSVLPVFRQFGFTNFIRDLNLIKAVDPTELKKRYSAVESLAGVKDLAKQLKKAGRFALRVISSDPAHPMTATMLGLAMSDAEGHGWYLPFVSPGSAPKKGELFSAPDADAALDVAATLDVLRPLLADEKIKKLGHDLNHDLIVLRNAGVDELRGVEADTMVAAWMLHPGRANLGLDHLSVELLGRETIPLVSLLSTGKANRTRPLEEVPVAELALWAAEQADVMLGVQRGLAPRIAETGVDALWRDVELPLIDVLVDMERRGIALDTAFLDSLRVELEAAAELLEGDIHELCGRSFNIRSPKQLAEVLFEERGPRGYVPVRSTRTGPSTDESTLEVLARRHPDDPLPGKILDYREVHRLLSGYVMALPKFVHPRTGRVHTTYSQCVTPTGRLTSSEPNLQAIPIRTEFGRRIRKAFVPGKQGPGGNVLIALDYSQIELRLVAHIAGDETMLASFARDEDIHRAVAARVNGVREEDVTSSMRSDAKAINFGIIYGVTAYGLSENLGVGKDEAQAFIDSYFATFPAIKRYIERTISEAHRDGFVTTMLNRRRYLPELKASNRMRRERAEREAVNTTVQGSAADLIKVAMIELHRRIAKEKRPLEMLLQIHDELVFEAPASEAEEQAAFAKDVMESALKLDVPLKVDVGIGPDWYEV